MFKDKELTKYVLKCWLYIIIGTICVCIFLILFMGLAILIAHCPVWLMITLLIIVIIALTTSSIIFSYKRNKYLQELFKDDK